ncbi:MAG: aminopeptidase [Bacteroidales bacterium]|nr:aminopeptidase [Bacteroidales bacterium]MCF8402772.1 aminopeptidase [Bacteroidales bacterium]
MKRIALLVFGLLFLTQIYTQSLDERLKALSERYDFKYKSLKVDTFFTEKYLLEIKQPVNQKKPDGETFTQRVFLSHLDFSAPVIFITEGYAAGYAKNSRYINELSLILNANQICVEHRYFGESIPKPINWEDLTISNAATDHHKVVEILKKLYSGKWVNTGISKGGQTAMYHRYFYPDDVDLTVGYVCPLNFSVEDKRIYRFLDQLGDSISRKRIFDYQYEMLSNKAAYLPSFKEVADKRKLTFKMGLMEAYELTVLEYPFAFWQWGTTPVDSIPLLFQSATSLVNHLDRVAGIDWISDQGIKRLQAFFYQAMTEIGFYGYDISPFSDVISFSENPVFDFAVPENVTIVYKKEPMQNVDHFIRHKAQNMIFIYGETDPWSATSVDITYNTSVYKFVKKGGSHLSRILNLPTNQKEEVIRQINDCLQ